MNDLPVTSPFQLDVGTDGKVDASLGGLPITGPLDLVPDSGPLCDWLEELELPKDWDKLQRLAIATGYSHRVMKFILLDESVTKFPGEWRFRPYDVDFHPWGYGGYDLTLAHLGLVIGRCDCLSRFPPGVIPEAEGACIIALATLFDSALATVAWKGIEQKIFTHVSGVVARDPAEPQGTGTLIEVGLIDVPGCPGARILKAWEA